MWAAARFNSKHHAEQLCVRFRSTRRQGHGCVVDDSMAGCRSAHLFALEKLDWRLGEFQIEQYKRVANLK